MSLENNRISIKYLDMSLSAYPVVNIRLRYNRNRHYGSEETNSPSMDAKVIDEHSRCKNRRECEQETEDA